MDDTAKYRDLFFDESDEYLKKLDDCLLQLEKTPDDNSILDEIFRAAHTLKGMAATMGYKTMTELTHRMENVFEIFRNGSSCINSDVISLIFRCLDKLSEIVEDLRLENYIDYDINDLLKELDNVTMKKNNPIVENVEVEFSVSNDVINDIDSVVIRSAQEKGYNAYNIAIMLSPGCLLKGARSFLVVNKLEQQGDILQSEPSPDRLEEGDFEDVFKLIYLSKLDEESVREIIENNSEIEEVLIHTIVQEETIAPKVSIHDNKEVIVQDTNLDTKSNGHHINQSIRVDLNKLDVFMNLVSELVIHRTRLENISNKYKTTEINDPLAQVARITSELQDVVLKIRMQPVNVVFDRFPRMIRDLSKELDKEIELVIEGEETELDRTVVSELGEPLVHLLRNAADHGIESVRERLALGKSKVGIIKLSAYQEGNRVVITVSDDGKGINPIAIKESATRKGINTEGMGDRDLVQLIFNQGFSTVKNVNNISGRGVGMDVVKQKIASLGGNINVISEVNKGTSFIIKLPLTLSIIQALMIKVGEETLALPLGIIEKIVKVEQNEIIESHSNEIYFYREKAITVIRINEKLSIESEGIDKHIIIVLLGQHYYGLLVDELIGQQEIVIKKLNGILGKMKEYLGATILGNGDVTLILDTSTLCDEGKGDDIE